jgi:hypothetical protein
MKNIPKQLEELRFNRVKFKEKRAFETNWQKNSYTFKQIHQYFPKENYGVICGEDVRVLDDDSPHKGLITLFLQHFGETFRVRDHLYFKFDNGHSNKIIFEHKSLLFPDSKGTLSPHLGELQGSNTYVVGPGSTHPDGTKYEIIKDLPIVTISYDKFVEVFNEYFKEKKQKIIRNHKPSDWKGDNITDIPIGNIVSFEGMRDVGRNCLQGIHPKHGSTNGTNFRVDVKNNTWICFRCNRGKNSSTGCGGPSELIAVMEGIIECEQAGASCFTQEQAQQVIKIAREKYGLTIPVKDLGEVQGWAKSVSIVRLAKKYDLEKCQICGNPFKFQDSHGMYYCDTCKIGGGLKKFAELISIRNIGVLK